MAIRIDSTFAVHPGDWLRTEIVAPHGLNVTAAACHLGVTRQAMSTLLNTRAGLSADMAIRFEKAFKVKADTLLRMQTAYELAQARANEGLSGWSDSGRRRERGSRLRSIDLLLDPGLLQHGVCEVA
jgi:addiction module HigA family antidote